MKISHHATRKVILSLICSLLYIPISLGQTCTGSTPANPGARTGNLYTASPINPGSTTTVHYVTGTFSISPANITMSGTSKLVIKTGSNITISGAYAIPNGCMIYVESGATLIMSGGLSFGNASSSLINLGRTTITGSITLGLGNIYNDGTLTASSYLWITQANFVFLNGGTASFDYILFQTGTGISPICLRPGSVFNIVSNSGSTISGSGSLPTGGLFQYNATDISNNTACTPANPARINYYDGFVPANAFLWGPSGTVADNANITIVGSTPASSNTGTCVLVTSGTGYVASTPQNFNLTTFSPVPTVTGNYFIYCLNSSVPLTSMVNGTNLLWYTTATGGSGSSTAPTINTSSSGLQTFWVNQNVTGSCLGPRNPINIDVSPTSAASAITATNNGPRCTGQSLTLTGGGTGISNWNWTGPNTYSSTTQSPTVSASATTAMSGTYTLITTQTTGTCLNSATTTAVVNGSVPAQPGAFTTSTSTVCQGQTGVSYIVPVLSGANSYSWTYTTGTGATINGSTNSITVDFSGSASSGTLNVIGVNACGNSATARSVAITVNNIPNQPSIITPSTNPTCNTSTGITYTVTNVGGISYAWSYSGTGSSITAGTGSNSITVNYTAATSGTWTVTPSNACGNGTTRTLVTTLEYLGTWTGSTNSSWSIGTNWTCGTIPTSSTDVTISAVATLPTNSGTANVRNLTIAPSATLTNNGTLNIYGNFTGPGTTSFVDNGLTAFMGSTPQTVTNIDTLHSVIVNNTTGVNLATPTYIKGHLTLTTGNLVSTGNLTVDLNTGAITGSGTGTISGNINVLKWVWGDQWHYISSVLSGRTVTDWNDDVTIKFGANSNLYDYDETIVDTLMEVGWTPITTTATTLQDMKGYALYFPRWSYKTTINLTGAYNHAQTYTSPVLTNTISAKAASDGWNLMGNPYPCVIDWDAPSGWTKTGLDDAIYVWDQKNKVYASYVAGSGTNGGSRYIPAMQGFFVIVNTPGGTGALGMNNNVRTTAENPDIWRIASETPIIKLSASNNIYKDETIVRFKEDASDLFDNQLDAYKISNGGNSPSIATKIGHTTYSINSLPNNINSKIIPVTLQVGTTGVYAINADITGFNIFDNIILEDRLLNVFQDLTTEPKYSATLLKEDTTTRFFLHYKNEKTPDFTSNNTSSNFNTGLKIYTYKQNVSINLNDVNVLTADVMVFDAIGNQIHLIENANTTSGKVEFSIPNANTGIYIVKVQSAIGVTTQQVYISR